MNEIPKALVDSIRNKNVILFVGSGFAYNSLHPEGKKAPLGSELATLIAKQFLGDEYVGQPLTYISDLAVSSTNLFEVQRFIYDTFEPFSPNEFQKLFSEFAWKAIFTTNYDLLIEKSYSNNPRAAQQLSTVFRNTREQDIYKTSNTVPYFKLHGCISYINDETLPLILSSEQYISHQNNRERLFSKFRELGKDYTFLFIGYSNQDWNIRSILKELENLKEGRPRSYMVSPNFTSVEENYWNERKITPIKMGYEEFAAKLSNEITEVQRTLSSVVEIHTKPIYQKFLIDVREHKPSESLIKFLENEVEFIHTSIPSTDSSPQAFYKGYFENWDPIIKNLDVTRYLKDSILEDIIFEDSFQDKSKSFFFCIKGYAGSGKSVLLRRLAWETAATFDKFCIFLKANVPLRTEPILELANYVKDRIYLFIDDSINNEAGIIYLLNKLDKEGIPVTLISTGSTNLLNEAETLKTYIDEDYELSYLSEREIEELIGKLTLHKSLGYLANRPFLEQKDALSEQSGRVLLVALHEATGGKNFEEIILNEYNSIQDETAKSLYLTVAILHRLGSYARAGLISRVHDISFNEFKRKFFRPLEYIVFDEKNYTIGDYIYKTRHPIIAQMIFNTVLVDPQARYDEYIRIFNFLDIDYNSDRAAFLAMTKAKQLIQLFNDPIKLRNLYDAAEQCSPEDPRLLQQRAIMEMSIPGGDSNRADDYLKKALVLLPKDPLISHSLAENALKKAERAKTTVERNVYIETAQNLSKEIIKKYPNQAYSYHTILKAKLFILKEQLKQSDKPSIEVIIKDIEKSLQTAKQHFPEQEFIMDIEARFKETIDNEPRALEILKQAYDLNKASPYIALRYAKTLENRGNLPEALVVLEQTIKLNPNEQDVCFRYSYLLSQQVNPNYIQIISYYRRSFTFGDNRYESQFWYGRALYINNEIDKAKDQFKILTRAKVNPEFKKMPRGVMNAKDDIKVFRGSISRIEANYAFLIREAFSDQIFINRHSLKLDWNRLKVGGRISFSIMFNYSGAVAVDIKLII
jgi:hypothetical protein